jgi:protein-disulfide isomerase
MFAILMYGRLLVTLLWRSVFLLLLICLGCSAQSAPSQVDLRIERQVRSYYNIPAEVNIRVSPRKTSEFAGYDMVTVTFDNGKKKQNYDFLLSKDDKTLIRMTKLDLTKDPYAEIMKKVDLSGRPTRGNKNAKVVAVNFDDFECPFCSRMHQTLFPELLKEYGDRVEFVYKDFPLAEIHPWAMHAAVDANCLGAQSNDAYWDLADYIHGDQGDVTSKKSHDAEFAELDRLTMEQGQKHKLDLAALESCVKAQNEDAVKASMKEGEALGVEATPTLFVNGEKLDGARPIGELRAVLDRALEQAGEKPPAHPASPPTSAPASSE